MSAAVTALFELVDKAGVIGRGVSADHQYEVGSAKISKFHGCGASANCGAEPDAGCLVAIVRTIGDIICAICAGEQLEQKASLI